MTFPGFGEMAERLRRSTVHVQTRGRWRGGGSGVIWSPNGQVITNAHVARAGKLLVETWDGQGFQAAVAKKDPWRDLALLQIEASGLPAAVIGDSSSVRVGELVLAVGNPLGFIGALSTGVVHATDPRKWIQADVRLAPGNSGGPLADAQGRVVGINTMVAGGLALAVPSNTVLEFLSQTRPRARLGVVLRPVPLYLGPGAPIGLLVLDVESPSPAAASSILTGDVLIGADGQSFRSLNDLSQVLESGREAVRLQFLRGGSNNTREVAVRLADRATEAA